MIRFIKTALFLSLALLFTACQLSGEKERPNILFILADDCSYNEIGCYGGLNTRTPSIDQFAKEGLQFNRAYVSMSMCVPCRAELYTGLYPLESGVAWNHSQARKETKSVFHYLSDLGYRVGLAGKTHTNPVSVYPYRYIPGFEENCVLNEEKKEDLTAIKAFIEENDKEPFCLFVCSTSPHAPWTMGNASEYPPSNLTLPPTLGDTPEVREAYSRYLAEISYFDRQVSELLRVLKETNKSKNTIVMLSTEQGWQFAGGKWTNWNLGVHTGFIVRWPGVTKPGKATEALIQFADVTPTLIELAGGSHVNGLSGTSFLDVIRGKKSEHRQFVYCMHNNIPEGHPYPIRSVISKNYHYIRNLTPDSTYFEKHLEAGAHGEVWWETWKSSTNAHDQFLVNRFYHRDAEELYSVHEDPDQFHNLANDPALQKELVALRTELNNWMNEQQDPGIAVDTKEAYKRKTWYNK